MPKQSRAFVITILADPSTSDLDVAQDLFDAVDTSGYDVIKVNPFGGDPSATIQVQQTNPTKTPTFDPTNDITLL